MQALTPNRELVEAEICLLRMLLTMLRLHLVHMVRWTWTPLVYPDESAHLQKMSYCQRQMLGQLHFRWTFWIRRQREKVEEIRPQTQCRKRCTSKRAHTRYTGICNQTVVPIFQRLLSKGCATRCVPIGNHCVVKGGFCFLPIFIITAEAYSGKRQRILQHTKPRKISTNVARFHRSIVQPTPILSLRSSSWFGRT